MTQLAERFTVSALTPLPVERRLRSAVIDHGHLLLALFGSVGFMLLRPPVADLQAADARAGAASRHVGLNYWLSWFGGSTPGQYSVLTPIVASLVGVTLLAAISVMLIAGVARPLLASTARPRSAAYLVVVSALCNLWSGRVPFSVAMSVSLLGLLLLVRGRPVLGGVVNGVATLFSPLGPSFLLLALVGPMLSRPDWRRPILRFAVPSAVGLAVPAVLFGAPAAMPYQWTTLAWSVGIVLAALLLGLPKHLRVGLCIALAVCVALFMIPSGVGSNISRYAYLLLPPLVWATARNPRRIVALALVPAFVYSAFVLASDINAASQPAAQGTYYAGLRTQLMQLEGRDNFRAEVLDTPTHRAATELIPGVYLARGWETQSDSTNNAIFYDSSKLNAISYRDWLDTNAVAWVAVPTQPGATYESEAALIATGLPYLRPIWQDGQWTLYGVVQPLPIVPAPAVLVSSSETRVVFDIAAPTTLMLRLRPAKFVHVASQDGSGLPVCLVATKSGDLQATFRQAGRYVLTSNFAVTSSVRAYGSC
jgi:hypothetical protein